MKEKPLSCLRKKVIAIDIAPFLYKWIYTFDTKGPEVRILSLDGRITSHLKGFLNFIKRLKEFEITPIICLDGDLRSNLKDLEVQRRMNTRKKKLDQLSELTKLGLSLTKQQAKQELHSSRFIGKAEKKLIIDCCEFLGVPYYIGEFIEGEAACAGLKKQGLADECMSLDRDVFLYGVSFFGAYDFIKKTIFYFDFAQNLDSLGLNSSKELTYCCIASGCDYTSGLPNVGPKKALKKIKEDFIKFQNQLKKQISNFTEIVEYLEKVPSLDFLHRGDPKPVEFTNFLLKLGFRTDYVLQLNSFLFANDRSE